MIRLAALVSLACMLPAHATRAEEAYPSATTIDYAGRAVCELSILSSSAERCLATFGTLTIVSVGIRMRSERVANYTTSQEYRDITARLKRDFKYRVDQYSQPNFWKE